MEILLNNLTVNDTELQYLLHSNAKSITLKGQCYFNRNRGAILIKIGSNPTMLIFSEARVKFTSNYIGRRFEGLSSVLVADGSSINFNTSHVVFENNYGQNCGGIAATNRTKISFSNSIVDFIGNRGEHGGAMSFYSMSVLSLRGRKSDNLTITFSKNKASTEAEQYLWMITAMYMLTSYKNQLLTFVQVA